ncbi:MAG: hypothetical protein HZB51_12090 [Chloroflexi bacterium]|nr:hypothetical protein [Chloroflexota bacterium]
MKFLLPFFMLFLIGCNASHVALPTQTSTPNSNLATPTTKNSENSAVSTASTITPKLPTTAPSTKPSSVTAKTPTATELRMQITAPADESIVSTAKVQIVGQTLPNAVVSVNGDLVNLDPVGKFQYAITLDEGANIIEIVASDFNGNEQDKILRVIYEP